MWTLISEMGWGITPDYKTISKNGFTYWGKLLMEHIHEFATDKVSELYGRVRNYELDTHTTLHLGSDDSMSDLLWHVVGCGKIHWMAAMQDPRLLQIRAENNNYKENFSYCFQEPEPVKTVTVPDCRKSMLTPLCHKCKNGLYAKVQGEPIEYARMNPSIFKGCSEDSRITWENRYQYCPIINP